MLVLRCSNRVETRRAARALGRVLQPGTILGLDGDLGAGKTFFVGAMARGLGVGREVAVTSPTFTLIHVVEGGRLPLYHVDLYRLDRAADIDELGLEEMLYGEGVTAVEWWPRLAGAAHPVGWGAAPSDALVLRFEIAGDRERRLSVEAGGPISRAVLERWREALAPPLC